MPATVIIATTMEMAIATLMLLFSGFLLFGSGIQTIPARALAAVTAVVGCSVMLSLLGSVESLEFARQFKPPLALLFGPALFIYLSQVRQGSETLSWFAWLHLLPALGGAALVAMDAGQFTDAYLNLCIGAYWIACTLYVISHRKDFNPTTVRRFVVGLVLIFGVVFFLDVILSYQAQALGMYRHLPAYLAALLATLAGTTRMMWTALKNPKLLAAPEFGIKYANSGLDQAAMIDLGTRFDELMSSSKAFLQEDVSLASVAAELNAQPRHVSQVVNSRHDLNFSAYVNAQRIEEASARLRTSRDSVTQVMYGVGFSSKSTFNREFKRRFGISPKEWRQNNAT